MIDDCIGGDGLNWIGGLVGGVEYSGDDQERG